MRRKNDPEGRECRRCLARFVAELVEAGPQRRAELVAVILVTAIPRTLGLLAEAMVERLGDEGSHAGAAEVLVALGPAVLPALESAVLARQSERTLLSLAPVVVALGRQLSEGERVALQLNLGIAAGLAPTMKSRVALDEVMWDLRDREHREPEAALAARHGS